MANNEDDYSFFPSKEQIFPRYLYETHNEYQIRKLIGVLRCYDCVGDLTLEQADSYMCRKTHQTISKLSNKGWSDKEILKECKRIYGNDILTRHYEFEPPIISYKLILTFYGLYLLRAKYFRVRWEKMVKYKRDKYY